MTENKNMFTARGTDAKKSMDSSKVDLKKVYLRMKSGDSVPVRILGAEDYVEYLAHASYTHGIYTQPCIGVLGQECPICLASKSGEDGFDVLYPRKRYLFVVADLETGELRVLDVSKNQAKKLIADIEEYREDLDTVAFNLKKIGEGTATGYTLAPILKMKGDLPAKFEAVEELEVTDAFLNSVLVPRTAEMQVAILKEAGFPVEIHMPHIKPYVKDETSSNNDGAVADTGTTATGQAGASAEDVLANM